MRYDAKQLDHGYQLLDGVEVFYDNRYDKLFSRSSSGKFYLIGKDEEWARSAGRKSIYSLDDGTVVIQVNSSEKNYLKKHFNKSREAKQALWNEFLHEMEEQLEELTETEDNSIEDSELEEYKGWRIEKCHKCKTAIALDSGAKDNVPYYCRHCCEELLK